MLGVTLFTRAPTPAISGEPHLSLHRGWLHGDLPGSTQLLSTLLSPPGPGAETPSMEHREAEAATSIRDFDRVPSSRVPAQGFRGAS